MEERNDTIALMGFGADIAAVLGIAVQLLAERAGISEIEAAEHIFQILQAGIKKTVEALQDILKEIKRECGFLDSEPRSRRRKRNRERARLIEQAYRAEIRRCERERPYRRIYKPPNSKKSGGNRQ